MLAERNRPILNAAGVLREMPMNRSLAAVATFAVAAARLCRMPSHAAPAADGET